MNAAVQTLRLDARQRAMLDEMGVKVWWPVPEAAEVPVAVAPAPVVEDEAEPVDMPPPDARYDPRDDAAPEPEPVAQRAPAAARAPVAAPPPRPAPVPAGHGAAVLVEVPRRLYADAAEGVAPQGGWLVLADMPPEVDGRHGEPFAGDAGRLLDNMLRALKLHEGGTPVHLMRLHRGVASGQPGGPRPLDEAFAEHAAALAPRLVLAMGPLAAQGLMQSGEPLGKLRGRVGQAAQLAGVPVVATYHPAYLLRNPVDKGRAWADLCLAAAQQQPEAG